MISVIIPVYKNTDLFLANLKQNIVFLKNCQIIIVNDDPSKSLRKDLRQFKNIILIENKKNLGFGQSINCGVEKAIDQYLLLLNSDVILNDSSYLTALSHFTNKDVFAVSFSQKEKDSSIVGKNILYWKDGLFLHKKSDSLKLGPNGWAEGGTCLIDKEKFLTLGGFDLLYSPFYWEDIDLSYRAWKAGYQIIFDPNILVIHHHESTIGKYFTKEKIKIIAYRNQLIFTWKNLADANFIINHLLRLPVIVIKSLLKGDYYFLLAFFKTTIFLPWIIKRRIMLKKMSIMSDRQVLSIFKNE